MVADEVLQGRLLQPAGAEGGAAVGVLEDGVAARRAFRREHCGHSQRDKSITGCSPRVSTPMIKYRKGFLQAKISGLRMFIVQLVYSIYKVNISNLNFKT